MSVDTELYQKLTDTIFFFLGGGGRGKHILRGSNSFVRLPKFQTRLKYIVSVILLSLEFTITQELLVITRQMDRHTHRQTHTQTDRWTNRQTDTDSQLVFLVI